MKDIMVKERYRVDYKIGEGGFGLVYAGTDMQSGEEVAIKMMHTRDELDILQTEAETYAALAGGTGIPRVMWYGDECDYYVMVHEMLGPSLEDLFNYCGRCFSLKTVLLIADQILARIQYIHDRGFLHRDVKPDNLLMGVGTQGNTMYMIDFGLAEEFCETERDTPRGGRSFTGTRRYASLNVHEGQEQSWRDDLESIGYVLLYFFRGSLPWQGLKAATESDKDELIKEEKRGFLAEGLCSEDLPAEFVGYMNYVRSLRFNQHPDYRLLRQQFRRLFTAQGYKYDNVYDWTEKLFQEAQNNAANP
ncbi:casein kinase I isoform delta [Trichoderma austrokoningii]